MKGFECIICFIGRVIDTHRNLVASGIQCGDVVSVECDGPDEQAALDGITAVLQDSTIKQ